jgi:hypothetical protein
MGMMTETDEPSYVMLEPESGRKYIVERLLIGVLPKNDTDSFYMTGRIVFAGSVMPSGEDINGAALLIGDLRYDNVTVRIERVEMETESARARWTDGGEGVIVPGPMRTWWDVVFKRQRPPS